MQDGLFKCKYGFFTKNGMEYVVTRPDTPKPWINVISNGDYGITVSQTGTGFSWLGNANLNRITRFSQDMVEDGMGKFLYLRDNHSGNVWSAGWKPVCRDYKSYECRHGIGYTIITSNYFDIETQLTLFVSPDEPVELMVLRIKNGSSETRDISLISYLEWNLGVYHFENREFQKIFIDNEFDSKLNAFMAAKRVWMIPNEKNQNMNTDWNYTAFHSSSETAVSFDGDRESFVGMYGNRKNPRALKQRLLGKNQGKWVDSIASIQTDFLLSPQEEKTVVFTIGTCKKKGEAEKIIRKYKDVNQAFAAMKKVKSFWKPFIETCYVETPDKAANIFTNIWLKYQAISCRIWSRTAYYQSGGAYGFRDQLQDSQVFLSFMPHLTKKQILLHAAHQYMDGTVKHWWHPMSEEGPDSRFSDDLLWLPFVTGSYIKETSDDSILDNVQPYLDGGIGTIYEHCKKSLCRVFQRFSPRGLPLIGEADWNDGLSACGTDWIGESVWVGEFLYSIINDFERAVIHQKDYPFLKRMKEIAACLKENINRYGWDGEWYIQCTTDAGKPVGSRENQTGSIFLNPQTWAVLSGIIPEERIQKVVHSVKKHLLKNYGPLLLYPAYTEVDKEIGYLTRYAPGLRENGGVYTHAATWAIQMFCRLKDAKTAYDIYKRICAVNRCKDIDQYKAEPYVLPGNTDGPDSPHYGQGGWTWYTGSAAWLYIVFTESILGIRPVHEGLLIDPCIPAEWHGYKIKRIFRGAQYDIEVMNPERVSCGIKEIYLDNQRIEEKVVYGSKNTTHTVKAIMG